MGDLTGNVTGFSAQIIRATITTTDDHVPVVIKQDDAAVIDREVTFYERFGAPISEHVPTMRGYGVDGEQGTGVLVLDDVGPADPLDVLDGCEDTQAEALVEVLARLHATYWSPDDAAFAADLPRWCRRPMDPGRWADRVAVARERFPDLVEPEHRPRLATLPADVGTALARLDTAPRTWIHGDVHLDNSLWRPDGRLVLLDWATSAVGPAAVDLAGCLLGGVVDHPDDDRAAEVIDAYGTAIRDHGIAIDLGELNEMITAAVTVMAQGFIGWAGSPGLEPGSRAWTVCAKQVRSALAWITR